MQGVIVGSWAIVGFGLTLLIGLVFIPRLMFVVTALVLINLLGWMPSWEKSSLSFTILAVLWASGISIGLMLDILLLPELMKLLPELVKKTN